MKKFSKNILKEFKSGFARFVAIMAIIALGVGFLIGISQSTPDMKTSMSNYLIENNAYDADIKAAYGLTQYDINSILSQEDENGKIVESSMAVVTSSVLASIQGGKESAVNLIGMDFSVVEDEENPNYLNHLTLVDGEFPENNNEVVVEQPTNYMKEVKIGDKITLAQTIDDKNSTYGDIYTVKEFTVVGIVSSPDYYYKAGREVTTVGTGVVSLVMYGNYQPDNAAESVYDLSKSQFFSTILSNVRGAMTEHKSDNEQENKVIYTDLWIKISGSEEEDRFYQDYKNYVRERMGEIENLGADINAELNGIISSNPILSSVVSADATWYSLDRASTNISYVSFDMNVEKVEDIAGIFPVFFIIVAALVALTSMTRMVEEERMQIGTLKALGYKEGTIMSKYLIYCILACLIGVVVGILLGFSIMPTIFWNAYSTMYYLPKLTLGFSWWLALSVVLGSLGITILVTVVACRTTTKEKPSVLMQPKAPKPGKRILLERVGFIWNRVSFRWKATIRNIFRYKKNMILTIVSVLGCTALILTGFGLGDSVDAVADLQYNQIIHYDTIVTHTAAEQADGGNELAEYLAKLEDEAYVDVYSQSGQLLIGKNSNESVDLYLANDVKEFANFVSIRDRKSGKAINYADDGIIIPENIATAYDLKKGSSVTYVTADRVSIELKVAGVCEYYTGSDVYMSADVFAREYAAANDGAQANLTANTLLIKYGYGTDEEAMNNDAESLLSDKSVTGVEFTYTTIRSFDALNDTMGYVILILVVCAGALAAIVLYNLTNMNIDERRREIATLRVLGYTKWEVAGYIYRESSILTIVGALFGLLVGWLLHMFIVSRVNSVMMMFGKSIAPLSFLWAFLITLGFAIVVYAFMLIKLYKINMAESLKSNE